MHAKTLILAAAALLMLCVVSALPVQQDEVTGVAVEKITDDSSSSSEEQPKDQKKQPDSSSSSEEHKEQQLIQKRNRRSFEDDILLEIVNEVFSNDEDDKPLSPEDKRVKAELTNYILGSAVNDEGQIHVKNRTRRDASSESSSRELQYTSNLLPARTVADVVEQQAEQETEQEAELKAEHENEQEAEQETEQQAEHEPTESQVDDDLVEPHDTLINLEDYAQGCEVTEVDSKEVDNETTYAE